MKIHLDGRSFRLDPLKFIADTNDADLRIRCTKDRPQYALRNGMIDEVALCHRALTQSEIRTAMKGNFFAVSPRDKVSTTWGDIKRRVVAD